MQNFHGIFETRKRSCIGAFSICMTLALNVSSLNYQSVNDLLIKEHPRT